LICFEIWSSNEAFENAVVKLSWSLRETPSTLKKGLEMELAYVSIVFEELGVCPGVSSQVAAWFNWVAMVEIAVFV